MSTPWKKLAMTLTAVGPLALAALAGCDAVDSATGQADRGVDNQIRQSQIKTLEGQDAQALSLLEKAAGDKSAGDIVRSRALSLLAEAEYAAALTQMQAVGANQAQCARQLAEMSDLGTQLSLIRVSVEGQRKLDPVAARKDIAAKLAAAKGGPDQPDWFKDDTTPLPTLSKVKQDLSNLEGQIAQLQEKIKALQAQRAEVAKQAEDAITRSEGQTGQASVDLYKQGSGQRKQAAELSIQVDRASAALVPLQHALAIAQSHESVLNNAIKAYQQQLADIESAWKAVQEKIAVQEALAKDIAEGKDDVSTEADGLPVARTVAGKATLLAKLLEANVADRQAIVQNLNNAAAHFAEAARAADSVIGDLNKKLREPALAAAPERSAWTQLVAVIQPMRFTLRQAMTQQTLAGVYLDQARNFSSRNGLSKELAATYAAMGLKLPEVLQPADLAAQLELAHADAAKAFETADGLLDKVIQAPSATTLIPTAIVARILTQFGWYQLEAMLGGDPKAQTHLSLATALTREARERQVPLPSLPNELAAVSSAAAPTRSPTTPQ